MKNFAKFIAFEGAEAVGKSTQIKLLSKAFHNAKLDNILSREPGGCAPAEKIRDLIFNNHFNKISELKFSEKMMISDVKNSKRRICSAIFMFFTSHINWPP